MARSSRVRWLKILCILALLGCGSAAGQKRVDRSVATINDGVRTEIITYSDLLGSPLQPGTQIDPPSQDDLNRALQLLINQRLFALEAERIPRMGRARKRSGLR